MKIKTCATSFLITRISEQLQIHLIFVFLNFVAGSVISEKEKCILLFKIKHVKNKFIKICFIGCASNFCPRTCTTDKTQILIT